MQTTRSADEKPLIGKKRILLIEDDEILRKTLVMILGDTLYDIDAGARLELLNRLTETAYDLVLVDLMIKPMYADPAGQVPMNIHFADVHWRETGIELIRRIRGGEYENVGRGTRANVPIIVMSARGDYGLKRQLQDDFKVAWHFEKPYEAEKVVRTIQDLFQD